MRCARRSFALTAECGVARTISAEQAARAVVEENFQRVLERRCGAEACGCKAGNHDLIARASRSKTWMRQGVYRLGLPPALNAWPGARPVP